MRVHPEDTDSSSSATEVDETENEIKQVCSTTPDRDTVTCITGGVKLNWTVDSGAAVNVINRTTW